MRFKASHFVFRNGHPYFMLRVPVDLTSKFNKRFIRKSLKTQNPADAKILAEVMASKAKSSFALLRAGVLTEEQEQALVAPSMPLLRKSLPEPNLIASATFTNFTMLRNLMAGQQRHVVNSTSNLRI